MIKDISILLSGNIFAQLIMLTAMPILTRLYLPEDFGILSLFNSIVVLVAVISSLRYELTIPLLKSKSDVTNMLVVCAVILLGFSVFSYIIILLFGAEILNSTNQMQFGNYIFFIPIGILALGSYQILNYVGIRDKCFSEITKSKLLQAITSTAIQLSLYNSLGLGLIVGHFVGLVVAALVLAFTVFNKSYIIRARYSQMRHLAQTYINFPKFSTWQGILNSLSVELPVFIVAICFSTHEAGIYMLVTKILTMPAGLIINSVYQVFYGYISNSEDASEISALTHRLHTYLIKITTPFLIIGFFISESVFNWIFGDNFKEGGGLVPYVMIAVYFQLQAATLTPLIEFYNKQRKGMIWNFFLLLTRGFGLFISVIFFDFETGVMLYAIAGTFMYLILLLWIFKLVNLNVLEILKTDFIIFVYSIGASFFILLAFFISHNISLPYLLIISAVGVFALWNYYMHFGLKK